MLLSRHRPRLASVPSHHPARYWQAPKVRFGYPAQKSDRFCLGCG
ncbi:Uncharacterised protein [Vibrio cholerae]|nr:Uncharacterised protein [Vibrio cholerae]